MDGEKPRARLTMQAAITDRIGAMIEEEATVLLFWLGGSILQAQDSASL